MSEETTGNCNVEEDSKDEDPPDLLPDQLPEDISRMWEIPQIYEFLCLAKDTLHIQHLSMYEMERMLLIPRASKQLANIMTCLLSPSTSKSKLRRIPSMPYEFWTKFLLAHKVTSWFKVYQSKDYDPVKVLDAIGVEPEFWKVFPDPSSISQPDLEQLSLRQRIWLLKTVCDTLMHAKRSLQEEVANKFLDGQGEKFLGRDRYGARYIYFPIFLDSDLRVYKHNFNNKILLNAPPIAAKLKLQVVQTRKRRRERRKTNRWKNGNLPVKPKKRVVRRPKIENELECNIKIEPVEQKDEQTYNNDNSNNINLRTEAELYKDSPEEKSKDVEAMSAVSVNLPEIEEHDGQTLPDDVSNSSKTDDEKINEIMASTSSVVCTQKTNCVVSKSDDEKLIETKTVVGNGEQDDKLLTDTDDRLKDEVGLNTWMKALPENNNYQDNINEYHDDDLRHSFNESVDDVQTKSKPVCKKAIETFSNILTDLSVSNFHLVADSVETLTDLVASLSAQNSFEATQPVRCEVLLIKKLKVLIESLTTKTPSLKESRESAREKLLREWKEFHNGTVGDDDYLEEGARGSNEWVLGSQGCPLLSYGDLLHQDPLHQDEDGPEKDKERGEKDEGADDSDSKQAFETRRVLRARGVSSYIEQFTSEEDSESSEGEGWSEIVDPATGMHIGLSSLPPSAKDRPIGGDQSGNTDSDQDWILPASRKRKNKRMSASRRLKSFQNKLQNIKVDPAISELLSATVGSTSGGIKREIYNVNPNIGPASSLNSIKIESVHSELDIKDEGPIIDSQTTSNESVFNSGMQQNYVLVNSTNGPMNYVVMPNENPSLAQPSPMVSVVPQVPIPQGYYVQGPQGYFLSSPQMTPVRPSYGQSSNYQSVQPMIIQPTPQQYVTSAPNYLQYQQMGVMPPVSLYSTTNQRPLLNQPIAVSTQSMKVPPRIIQNRQIVPPHQPRHPDGAVIRSTVPFQGSPRQSGGPPVRGRLMTPRNPMTQRNFRPTKANATKTATATATGPKNTTKTTSLIVLSDSDDEIEMIITEKCDNSGQTPGQSRNATKATKGKQPANKNNSDAASIVTAGQSSSKGGLTPQIIQRMSQGGISITPVKPRSSVKTPPISGTQLVVVVNETGSHYALALPNGSKLILTPEQVAQIRASNGGKLAV